MLKAAEGVSDLLLKHPLLGLFVDQGLKQSEDMLTNLGVLVHVVKLLAGPANLFILVLVIFEAVNLVFFLFHYMNSMQKKTQKSLWLELESYLAHSPLILLSVISVDLVGFRLCGTVRVRLPQ